MEDIRELIHALAQRLNTHILRETYHRFEPIGVTGIAIVSASHISVHSWPEYGFLSVDIFSCKPFLLEDILTLLKERLGSDAVRCMVMDRGTAQ